MSPLSKIQLRRRQTRQKARALLQDLLDGKAEAYDVYRGLYSLWCGNNVAVEELRPFFRIAGIEPDGRLSVTDEFKSQVRSIAESVLLSLKD